MLSKIARDKQQQKKTQAAERTVGWRQGRARAEPRADSGRPALKIDGI
jgi:hypothetical protein